MTRASRGKALDEGSATTALGWPQTRHGANESKRHRAAAVAVVSGRLALAAMLVVDLARCAPANLWGEDDEPGGQKVVGGRAQSDGYDAAGYLAYAEGSGDSSPLCGAVLVEPDVALTAAHCIEAVYVEGFVLELGVGFGEAGSGPLDSEALHRVRAAFVHPEYDESAEERFRHDVAVLVLEHEVAGVEPARIGEGLEGCEYRYVGYGRTTPGGSDEADGYTNERRSAAYCITDVDGWSVFASGEDGGLCWGDSGGPLLREGSGDAIGVLADFDGIFYCEPGNAMIFTSLDAERRFIDCAVEQGTTIDSDHGCRVLRTDPCACEGCSDVDTSPCEGLASCSECTAEAACGWCASTGSCAVGTSAGPDDGSCADWRWVGLSCDDDGGGGGDDDGGGGGDDDGGGGGDDGGGGGDDGGDPEDPSACGEQESCLDCVGLETCGWCNSLGRCTEGSFWGPADDSCGWLDWAWSSTGAYCSDPGE